MLSGLVKGICQIGVFLICAQAIVHFRPKASYEKYLKVLVSSMILIQLFMAVGGIFSAEGKAGMTEYVEWFTETLNESMRRAADNTFFADEDMQFRLMAEDPEETKEKTTEKVREITVQIAPIAPIRVGEVSSAD